MQCFQRRKTAVGLTRQAQKIQAALDSINPLNAGKKSDEVISMLNRFFPNMESFETQVRKHKREIDRLEKENASLAKRAEVGEKVSISRELSQNKLRSDYDTLRRFVDSLPEEIRRQAKPPQKTHELGL